MKLEKALPQDFNVARSLYWAIIDGIKDSPFSPKWEKGIYPTDASLSESIEKQQMYFVREEGKAIVGSSFLIHRSWGCQIPSIGSSPYCQGTTKESDTLGRVDEQCPSSKIIRIHGVSALRNHPVI